MLCAILYHLYHLKNVKNNHGGVLLLVKCYLVLFLQTEACDFTVFRGFTVFKLYKWYQIAQSITNDKFITPNFEENEKKNQIPFPQANILFE